MDMIISRACAGHMHLHCDGCACPVCHNVCALCGRECRSVYEIPAHENIPIEEQHASACAACYRRVTVGVPKGQGCERCGGPTGYRNSYEPAGDYLCITCRVTEGSLVQVWHDQ